MQFEAAKVVEGKTLTVEQLWAEGSQTPSINL